MIHSKRAKNNFFLSIALLGLSVLISFYVIKNFDIWGPVKGPLGAGLWLIFMLAFVGILFLDTYKVIVLYTAIMPFLLRLNITNFTFEIMNITFHPFVIAEVIILPVLMIKLLINSRNMEKIRKASLYEFLVFYGMLIYIVGSVISGLLTSSTIGGNTVAAMISSFGQALIPSMIMIFVFHSIRTREQILLYLNIFYLSFIMNIAIGAYSFLLNIEPYEIFFKRMAFNFNGSNVYAAVAQIFIPLGVFLLSEQKTRRNRIIYYIFIFIVISSLIMTLSRGGIIAAFFSLILLSSVNTEIRKPMKKIWIILGIVAGTIFTAVSNLILRFTNLLATSRITEFSTLIRTAAWKTSLESILRYPLGIGGNQFPLLWSNVGKFPSQTVLHSHNFILGICLEYGIIACAGFLLIFVTIIFKLIQSIKANVKNLNNRLSISLIASICGYILMGIVSEGPRCHLRRNGEMYNDGLIFLFIVLGVALRFISIVRNDEKNIDNSSS